MTMPNENSSRGGGERVTLRSISGRSVTLPFPVTFSAVFAAAVAPPFCFTPESVKIFEAGRLVHLATYIKQHSSEGDGGGGGGGFVDASAYTVAAAAPSSPLAAHVSGGVAGRTGTSASEAVSGGLAAAHSAPGRGGGGAARTLMVYGVPQRAKAPRGHVCTDAVQKASPSASGGGDGGLAAQRSGPFGGTTTWAASAACLSSGLHTSGNGNAPHTARHLVKDRAAVKRSVTRGPLPYPHSPDGLLELAKAVSDPDADAGESDDLISLFHGVPQGVYNHLTMRYISNKVKGNLVTLQAVMEQIYSVAPVFYAWVEANPQKFLSALNRDGERSLQQVRDQLRVLALQAVAGQMSGDGPSRRVMMLEVNTRDGTPDVYQVEVQVGDFDDDDDDDMDDDSSSGSDSLYFAETEQDDEQDFLVEEEEEDVDVTDDRGGDTDATESEHNSAAEEHERDGVVLTDGAGEEREPHRGAILLSPAAAGTGTGSSLPSKGSAEVIGGGAGGAAAADTAFSVCPGGFTATPSPPPGSFPARSWRPSASPSARIGGAAAVARSAATDAASQPSELDAGHAPADAADEAGAGPHEDARLARLRGESAAVETLRNQYTRQGDDLTALRMHQAIMALRPQFFALAGEVCSSISAALSSSSSSSSSSSRAASGGKEGEKAIQYGALLRRVVQCACDFFGVAEEFYAQLEEEGVRTSVFGPAPQESLAAWAAVAALSRLLMCDVDTAGQEAVVVGSAGGVVAGPRRVGALRALRHDTSLWSSPALHWAFTRSPEELLAAVLQLCRQQRAVMVWYSSHYLVKAVGKTIQTMAYIFGGTEEAQQPVVLQRLKITSKAHKSDEVADTLREMLASSSSTGVPDAARLQWLALMRLRYQQLVRPIAGDLPTPHMTSNTLYVCDTRHVLPPKESLEDRSSSGTHAAAVAATTTLDSAARWWGGYCDDRSTMCVDKWCLAATLRPWNAAMASENARDTGAVEKTAVRLMRSRADDVNESGSIDSSLSVILPVEQIIEDEASTSSATAPTPAAARHTVVLYEQPHISSTAAAAGHSDKSAAASSAVPGGLSPHFVGDIHVIDAVSTTASSVRLAGGALVSPHLATVVRNYHLPEAAHRSLFLRQFFEMFARHPQIPAAAAARHAAMTSASANDAPWLVCEYVLLDYGGAIRSLTTSSSFATPASTEKHSVHAARGVEGETNEDFIRMPCVPLGRRLSEPRPVSVVSRTRSNSQPDSDGGRTAPPTATTTAEEDAVKRQYARTHAIDELYEMMLGSLLEHQPTGEVNVLDHLVSYLEASEGVMQTKVQRRQAAAAAGVDPSAVPVVVPVAKTAGAAATGSFAAPQPPSNTRHTTGRPSFWRRKPSS
jgi:hypothetical protein